MYDVSVKNEGVSGLVEHGSDESCINHSARRCPVLRHPGASCTLAKSSRRQPVLVGWLWMPHSQDASHQVAVRMERLVSVQVCCWWQSHDSLRAHKIRTAVTV